MFSWRFCLIQVRFFSFELLYYILFIIFDKIVNMAFVYRGDRILNTTNDDLDKVKEKNHIF
jgi:hypothetical protein